MPAGSGWRRSNRSRAAVNSGYPMRTGSMAMTIRPPGARSFPSPRRTVARSLAGTWRCGRFDLVGAGLTPEFAMALPDAFQGAADLVDHAAILRRLAQCRELIQILLRQ